MLSDQRCPDRQSHLQNWRTADEADSHFAGSKCTVCSTAAVATLHTCFILGSWFPASFCLLEGPNPAASRMGRLSRGGGVSGKVLVYGAPGGYFYLTLQSQWFAQDQAEALSVCPRSACPACSLQANLPTTCCSLPALLRDTAARASPVSGEAGGPPV